MPALSLKQGRHQIIYFHELKYFRLVQNCQAWNLLLMLNEKGSSGEGQSCKGSGANQG